MNEKRVLCFNLLKKSPVHEPGMDACVRVKPFLVPYKGILGYLEDLLLDGELCQSLMLLFTVAHFINFNSLVFYQFYNSCIALL